MSDCILRFVDRIDPSPTVLFDFAGEWGPRVGTSFSPPRLRRQSQVSSFADGSWEASSTYEDRQIVIELGKYDGSPMEHATDLQTLLRILDRDESWLMWQPTATDDPVFFRTKRADTSVVDMMLTAAPQREVSLAIPAHPFAFGLNVSGVVEILNNALGDSVDNPMGAEVPWAKGDVESPLWLAFQTPAKYPPAVAFNEAKYRSVVSSWHIPNGIGVPDPITAAPTGTGVGGGTTATFTADATMTTGNRYRVTTSSINASRILPITVTPVAGARDYRVFLRAKLSGGRVSAKVGNAFARLLRGTAVGPEWFDLGVTRLPTASVEDSDPFNLSPPVDTQDMSLLIQFLDTTGATIDIDLLMFIPVGPDCRYATQSTYPTDPGNYSDPTMAILDGINDRRYASWSAAVGDQNRYMGGLEGDLPTVRPGGPTKLSFLPVVAFENNGTGNESGQNAEIPDPLNTTTVVSWSYFPRYLYLRGVE
ncbi:hypothetical protein HMPREF0063_10049 [Aeromicrobium marinum DSM 15272]|uniref:Uncharacterized protein n=1 Tax=Aeromicrobium marinum DSM 15272 TaxID=585531 RepID=E2S7P2_9ACTN|nr:hypothetical protein HMPREF0063_10049 [Aeromicrobium marinum DSM 15272]